MNKLATSAIDLYASTTVNNSNDSHVLDKNDNELLASLYAIRSVAHEENEKISDAVNDLERAMNLSEIIRHGYIHALVC